MLAVNVACSSGYESRLLEKGSIMKTLPNQTELLKLIPALEYVTNIHSRDYRHILADGVSIYNVMDRAEFYSALGCTLENSGGNPDEYIWGRYNFIESTMSRQCLQIQIFVFLCSTVASFKKKYASLRKMLIGCCQSEKIDYRDDHCLQCPLHLMAAY